MASPDFVIRPAQPEHDAGIVAILNRATPDSPLTVERLRHDDATRDPSCRTARWVAIRNGEVIGLSSYTQYIDLYHPRKFWINVRVDPQYRCKGAGSALYDVMAEGVQAHDPLELKVSISEDNDPAIRFITARGFVERARRFPSTLDVSLADLTPYADLQEQIASRGIRIISLNSLKTDPDRDRKLHALWTEVDADAPLPDPVTPMTFDQFRASVLEHPAFVPEGTYIAVHGDQYVGVSAFYRRGDTLDTDLTGVRRDYRRLGIALGLKARGVQFAREHGYRRITTTNDPANAGMLAINDRLGFVRDRATIQFVKTLKDV